MAASLLTLNVKPMDPSQNVRVTLDGRVFVFRFWWNQRISRWFFDLETESGISILRAKGLCAGADALRQVRARPEAPQGVLTVMDTSGKALEPSLASIGVDAIHRVVYFSDGAPPAATVSGTVLAPSIGV
jgi:hypothetical protein